MIKKRKVTLEYILKLYTFEKKSTTNNIIMPLINTIEAFLVGLCIGSFLNVVIYRLPNEMSILRPRSFCPKCKNSISWRSNIPLISFLIQRGKCNFCGKEISFRYPIVELITGISFVIFNSSSPYFYSFSIANPFEKIFTWFLLSILIAISFIDFDHFWIPQSLINFGFFVGLINLLNIELYGSKLSNNSFLLKGLFASLGIYLIFECLRITARKVFKKDALGKGDSKLVAMIALWLGPVGIVMGIAIAYIIAAIFLLASFQIKKIKKGQIIPFAPFLSMGGLIVWFFGNQYLINFIYRI